MNLIDRYVSAVAQQLPPSRRDDIARELKANILDRLESFADEHGRPSTPADESAILRELGHPRQAAAGYLPPQQLVSPNWFPFYTQCLAYGLAIVVLVQLLGVGVTLIGGGKASFGGLIGGLIHGSLIMFASVTGVFYLLTNLPATANLSPYCGWKPEQLPPVKQPWQRISLCDSTSEFAGNLFLLLALQYPLWVSSETIANSPVAIGPGLQTWVLPLSIAAAVALAINLWNFRQDYWTPAKLKLSVVLRLIAAALCFAIALTPDKLVLVGNADTAANLAIITRIGLYVFVGAACISLFEAGRSAYRLYLLRQIA
jgi:hypothetical protein